MKRIVCTVIFICLILQTILVGEGATESVVRDTGWFLRALRSVDTLPVLEDSHTAMSSTWDRAGGNYDNLDFKRIEGKKNILLDVDGRGCIHRIFTGILDDHLKDTRIQIYLDHSEAPVFDMPVQKFYDDKHGPLPYPLASQKSYPGILMPIPFSRHIRVQLANESAGKPGFAMINWGNYWQITYTRYGDGIRVESLQWPLPEDDQKELELTCQAWLQAETQAPKEPNPWTHQAQKSLPPGQSLEETLSGAGVIQQLFVKVMPGNPDALRGVRLRIQWDGQDNPSVDVPVGRFWGNTPYGYGRDMSSTAAVQRYRANEPVAFSTNYNGLLMNVSEKGCACRFPMPFRCGAKVALVNCSKDVTVDAELAMAVKSMPAVPETWGRFHATYRENRMGLEEIPKFGPQNIAGHVVLDRRCRGKYVGVMLHLYWPYEGWWGEGDWLIWTDENSWPPSYHGTGSEEYFNSGWGSFDRKALSGFVGLRPGHPTVYSFHINDAFQFNHNVRVVEEQMPWGLSTEEMRKRQTAKAASSDGSGFTGPYWDSVAFWYALPAQPAGSF